ncbi:MULTISPECIES: hypothetical protein [unclassified Coleofasciculus]|uniref:hypothetical protein n=1 Tax=unclassified Coleofasciculus TaxID=2692782 RepID=UPI00187F28E7|nr:MULTISPECIES: hypothetical protein [unclassified Coleofasciculus]MBE9125596.1 hypothetical protein [Coleofasciculus sp. LEGE 07081]MBE9147310.1 hypothetical protein [Coleofasciculus sp. LEGE 07092]
MSLTIQQRFGVNSSLVNQELRIILSDLTAVGLEGSSPTADQILDAILQLSLLNQPQNAVDDPTIGIVVAESLLNKAFVQRGTTEAGKQIEYQKTVSSYVLDTITDYDPDNLVS